MSYIALDPQKSFELTGCLVSVTFPLASQISELIAENVTAMFEFKSSSPIIQAPHPGNMRCSPRVITYCNGITCRRLGEL